MTKEAKSEKQELRPSHTSEASQRGYCAQIIDYWRARGHPEVEAYPVFKEISIFGAVRTSKVTSLEIWSNVAEWWQSWDGDKARAQHRTQARRQLSVGDDEPAA